MSGSNALDAHECLKPKGNRSLAVGPLRGTCSDLTLYDCLGGMLTLVLVSQGEG